VEVDGVVLGAGLYNRGLDQLAVAVLGRQGALCPEPDQNVLIDFDRFCSRIVDMLIKQVNVPDGWCDTERGHLDIMSAKTTTYLDGLWDVFNQWRAGPNVNRKAAVGGVFIKDESNGKVVQSRVFGRPRGIYEMSDRDKVLWLPMLVVLGELMKTPFVKAVSIKGCDREEIIAKVLFATFYPHMLSDYSKFESSIRNWIRKHEGRLMRELLPRMGQCGVDCLNTYLPTLFGRMYRGGAFRVWLDVRSSGDFITAAGNLLVNIFLTGYEDYVRSGLDFGPWSLHFVNTPRVYEGDDAVVRPIHTAEFQRDLGFDFDVLVANAPGPSDFCRMYPARDDIILDVYRVLMRYGWLRSRHASLKVSKLKFLYRASALSLHYRRPHHPVLWALVKRVGELTSGTRAYKSWAQHAPDIHRRLADLGLSGKDVEKRFPDTYCSDHRVDVSVGGPDRVGIPIGDQLWIEEQLHSLRFGVPLVLPSNAAGAQDYPVHEASSGLVQSLDSQYVVPSSYPLDPTIRRFLSLYQDPARSVNVNTTI
jgi:hypothetical protein